VVHERSDGVYELTPASEPFLSSHPGSLRGAASFTSYEFHAWAEFEHTLSTGEVGFDHQYRKSHFDWLSENAEISARFDKQMERRTAALLSVANPLVDRLPETGLIIDIGGGNGYFLASVLRARPHLTGIVADLPHVVAGCGETFAEAGVSHRARAEAINFFESVPPGGDVYMLLSVIHDWDDVQALRILESVRQAMPEGSLLLIGDAVLSGPNAWDSFKNLDLHMLVIVGGRERSEKEWRGLLGRAGFESISITRSPTLSCIAATRA
jgi:hypothetical protein